MPHLRLALFVLLLAASCSGCAGLRGRLFRALPPTTGYDTGEDDSSDPWIAEAADEGRSEYKSEREADPLGLKPLFMSQKARDIERDLGIE